MRVVAIAAAAGLVLLAACDNQTDPSPPPTTEDALTTVTEAPTTRPDDVDVTTDAAPTTAEPTTSEPTTSEPVADDGPPEMPAEAQEQTQGGAAAFAMHYINLVNYTGRYPTLGLLEPLAQEGCQSCANRADAVAYGVEHGDHLREDTFRAGEPSALFLADAARVAVPVEQVAQDYYRGDDAIDRSLTAESATLVIRMDWEEGWLISGITVEQ